jgi:carbonic anhydrase/acetyltransferase-like protein (isoleucine patch superfamily)
MPKYIKKFELTSQKMTLKRGLVLYRIRALRDFACVKKGDLGGWIEKESNLATDYDYAWVAGNAKVYGNARVEGDGWVTGNARVYGNAQIIEEATVENNAIIYGSAKIADTAKVSGNARVYDEAKVSGSVQISGEARIYGSAEICERVTVCGKARVHGKATLYGDACIFDSAAVCGDAVVSGKARIGGDAKIEKVFDYVTVSPVGAERSILTLTKSGLAFSSCFGLTWSELLRECRKKYVPRLYANQYRSVVRFAESFFS